MNASLEKAIQEAMIELDRMSGADWNYVAMQLKLLQLHDESINGD